MGFKPAVNSFCLFTYKVSIDSTWKPDKDIRKIKYGPFTLMNIDTKIINSNKTETVYNNILWKIKCKVELTIGNQSPD